MIDFHVWTDNLHDAIWRRLEGSSSLGHNLSQVARSSVQLPENLESAVEIRSAHWLLRFNPIFLSISLFDCYNPFALLCHCLEDKWGRRLRPSRNFISVFNDYSFSSCCETLAMFLLLFEHLRNLGSASVIKFVRFISLDLDVRFAPSL